MGGSRNYRAKSAKHAGGRGPAHGTPVGDAIPRGSAQGWGSGERPAVTLDLRIQ